MDFMRHEYQRQHAPQQAQPVSVNQNYGRRGWSSFAEWSPPQDVAPRESREPVRAGPQVHVDNPDFLNYTADRLQTKSLAKACEPQADQQANASGDQANAPADQSNAPVDQSNTVPTAPTSDFAKACAATQALKPDFIVGAGSIASRHDAMSKGELGPDYIFFGPLSGVRDPEQREMARWWAEIMDVPSVLSDPAATAETATSEGSEFIALSDSLWSAPEGVTARLGAIAKALEAKP